MHEKILFIAIIDCYKQSFYFIEFFYIRIYPTDIGNRNHI